MFLLENLLGMNLGAGVLLEEWHWKASEQKEERRLNREF
jgi:hypothetical protein